MSRDDRPAERSPAVPPRLWTAEEANGRIASLGELLPQLAAWAVRLTEVHAELQRITQFWGREADASDQPDHGLKDRLEAERRNLSRRLDDATSSLHAEGIEVKDLLSGLVDFYALLDGELVFLCWQRGEPAVGFYHTLHGGFRGRRPLPGTVRSVSPQPRGIP
jgi:hypothetical protein